MVIRSLSNFKISFFFFKLNDINFKAQVVFAVTKADCKWCVEKKYTEHFESGRVKRHSPKKKKTVWNTTRIRLSRKRISVKSKCGG